MKKITLFVLLLTLPLVTFSQDVVYNFDTTTEGWLSFGGILDNPPVGGIMTLNTVDEDGSEAPGGLYPDTDPYSVNTNTVKTLKITLKNESTTNNKLQAKLFFGVDEGVSIAITTSDAAYKTYSIDLTQITGWTGSDFFDFELYFINDTSGNTEINGNILIDKIEFLEASLSIEDNQLQIASISPNPVKDFVKIDSPLAIDTATIYNQIGQKVKVFNSIFKNTLDLSSLKQGLYFMTLKSGIKSNTVKIIKK